MERKKMFVVGIFVVLGIFLLGLNFHLHRTKSGGEGGVTVEKAVYFCPMHPDFVSDHPGNCPICGMSLVKKETSAPPQKAGPKKLLYYRNPMDPSVTSPVPMKDPMGMDYVPVYEESAKSGKGARSEASAGVYISPEKQQLIGVKKETVQTRPLVYEIRSVGKVAYDPELYIAQEEYLQLVKTARLTKNSVLPEIAEQTASLMKSGEQRLLLLGMSPTQIAELAKRASAEENLFLSANSSSVWIYITVYEQEMALIKEGTLVEVEAAAFPGEIFKGKVAGMTPVLDAATRAVQVRAEVQNPDNKLKPRMFVNAKMMIDLGEKLAVPEAAVLDTGVRKIVYVNRDDGTMEPRVVRLGQKAQGYFEVLAGLEEGEMVVTSGNFLVDSESKLKGVVPTHND